MEKPLDLSSYTFKNERISTQIDSTEYLNRLAFYDAFLGDFYYDFFLS